ncbi:hypothetical protein GCM10027185_20970 [Spirosoma pulveris]
MAKMVEAYEHNLYSRFILGVASGNQQARQAEKEEKLVVQMSHILKQKSKFDARIRGLLRLGILIITEWRM